MIEIKYSDEIKYDKDLGCKVKIRHIEKLTPELETAIERMNDFYRISQLLTSEGNPEDAVRIIQKYINMHKCENANGFMTTLGEKVQEIEKEQAELFESEKADDALKQITNGRYPSYFTLNHSGNAKPQTEIDGGLFVCTNKNSFWDGQSNLYVFGNKNEKFKEYLREIREAAEKIEGLDFFNGLPLQASKEQIINYIKTNPDTATINGAEFKNAEEGIKKNGTDFVIMPNIPLGLTRINGRVKKGANLGELIMSCFMGGVKKSDEEKKNGNDGHTFKGIYNGKDNLEAVTVLYSGLPYAGLGDWGGRIEVSPNEMAPEVYKDFKDKEYKFGDLAELMINLKDREVIFFNEQ